MVKLAILHYMPLEYYPPATNLLDYVEKNHFRCFKSIKVYSCNNVKGRLKYKPFDQESSKLINKKLSNPIENNSLIIKRSPFPEETNNSILRLIKYLHYNIFTLIGLVTYRPNNLLYYESYSAWPAYVYTKYFNRNCYLYIHHHEYASKDWYANTMKLVRYYHQLEKKWLYPRAQWISQTNEDRLEFFHQDHPNLKKEQLKIMPNYPPKNWNMEKREKRKEKGNVLKLAYIGSLSFQSTYLKELCEWIIDQNGKIQLDIYAYNLYLDVKDYLKSHNTPHIKYYGEGIEYNDQPKILSQYDVGLILYKAHNQNYTYNAPNKLFEYLACDLDVWYPNVLEGPKPYNTQKNYPKVIPVDFENLDQFNWQQAFDKSRCEYRPSKYFYEDVYKNFVKKILENH